VDAVIEGAELSPVTTGANLGRLGVDSEMNGLR